MVAVNPIPEGVHTINPYIIVRDTAEAIEFYQKAFGVTELQRQLDQNGKLNGVQCPKTGLQIAAGIGLKSAVW